MYSLEILQLFVCIWNDHRIRNSGECFVGMFHSIPTDLLPRLFVAKEAHGLCPNMHNIADNERLHATESLLRRRHGLKSRRSCELFGEFSLRNFKGGIFFSNSLAMHLTHEL